MDEDDNGKFRLERVKVSPKNYPVVCDGYVKYEAAEVDRLAIMQDFRDNENKQL